MPAQIEYVCFGPNFGIDGLVYFGDDESSFAAFSSVRRHAARRACSSGKKTSSATAPAGN